MKNRFHLARKIFEPIIFGAALLVPPVIFVEETVEDGRWLDLAQAANWLIWSLFAAEVIVLTALSRRRWQYLKSAWLDLGVVVVSFPTLPSLLTATRLLRLARLARVLRILRFARLGLLVLRGTNALRAVFRTRGLGYLAAFTVLVTLFFGAAFAMVEGDGDGLADGIWWALVTVTTVGYGDLYPETLLGRVMAGILMLVGMGFVAALTAAIAAHFVGEKEEAISCRLASVEAKLDLLEGRIGALIQGLSELKDPGDSL